MPWGAPTISIWLFCVTSGPPAPMEPDDAPAVAEAQQEAETLYAEGIDAYETADYTRAIELFEGALRSARRIEDADAREHAVASLQYNIARAHVRAHEVDGDTNHLRVALTLLEQHAARVQESERGDAEALQREVKRRLDAKREPPPSAPSTKTPSTEAPARRPGVHPLTIAGAVLLPLAGAGAGVMIGGLVVGGRAVDDYREGPTRSDRDDARRRGRVGNGLAIGGGVAAASLAVVGTVLLVVGQRKRNDTRARVAPSITPGTALLVLDGKF